MTIEEILGKLKGVRASRGGFVARFPAHEDRSPSLNLREADDRILIHCFSGCNTRVICAALGIQVKDRLAIHYATERAGRRCR